MSHSHHTPTVSIEQVTVPEGHPMRRLPRRFALIGLVFMAISGGLGFMAGEHFFWSYLTAFMFWMAVTAGSLWFVLIHYAVRAGWSTVARRLAESISGFMPWMALLFIPILVGAYTTHLYHWTHPEGDPILEAKVAYLNLPFFTVRAVVFLGVWSLIARYFYRNSLSQDGGGRLEVTRRSQWWAPVGILFLALSSSFAAFDWMMSLDPHWYSTIYGVYFFANCIVGFYATLVILCLWLHKQGMLHGVITLEHFHDMGKMMFAFTVFWAYIAFSQFLLIWYGNIPEETMWYAYRLEGAWGAVTVFLLFGKFIVPFLFLMSRHMKRNKRTIFMGAAWLLFMIWVDMFWLTQPTMAHAHAAAGEHGGLTFHMMDVTLFLGFGAFFVSALISRLVSAPMVAVGDPRIKESIAFENF